MLKALGNVGTTIFHPVGTCKMGPADDESAVVDPTLKVHGIDGLRLIDVSVMLGITSGNTNSPVVMIAERGAAMISGRNGGLAGLAKTAYSCRHGNRQRHAPEKPPRRSACACRAGAGCDRAPRPHRRTAGAAARGEGTFARASAGAALGPA